MSDSGEIRRALDRKALARASMSGKAERAALYYARWQGLTDASGDTPSAAHSLLDALLDEMEPEDWEGIKKAATHLGDATFEGLLSYAVGRVRDQNAEGIKAFEERHPEAGKASDRDRS